MKKYLVFLIVFLTSLFFVGNVSAYTSSNLADRYPTLNVDISYMFDKWIDFTNFSEEEITALNDSYIQKAMQWGEKYVAQYDDVDSYFIIGSGGSSLYIGLYNSADNPYISMRFGGLTGSYSRESFTFYFLTNSTIKRVARVLYDVPQFNSGSNRYINSCPILTYDGIYKKTFTYKKSYNYYFYGTLPIKYDNNADFSSTTVLTQPDYFYNNVSIEDNDLCYTLRTEDIFYYNGQYPFAKKEPSFGDMELIKNYSGNDIYSIQMKLPVKNYDSNYIYQFKKSTDIEWSDFSDYYVASDNAFEDLFYDNGSFYYRILDQENNVISTTNLTISSIVKTSPYLTFDINTPEYCILNIADENYTTCKNLDIITHNLSENNSVGYYSYDNENWTIFYSDITLKIVNNGTLYFKVVDINDNNNILSTFSFSISGINESITILDEYKIKFLNKLASNKTYTDLSIIFYNVDTTLRKYYYTTDFKVWTDVTSLLVDNDNYSKKYLFKLYFNGTIGARVEDLDGNILSYSTITITKIETVTQNSILGYISNFVDSLKDYSDFFNSSFDLFFNGLPEMVKLFLLSAWCIFLSFFVMQLGGWK